MSINITLNLSVEPGNSCMNMNRLRDTSCVRKLPDPGGHVWIKRWAAHWSLPARSGNTPGIQSDLLVEDLGPL
ncbi:hypothetical protein RRG08_034094 [Elysia crispata]|uniref:Uncharacterized protein n=1 Tax=Elysia crispata TaxID=231223 RepID=A0AAE0YSC3_9GAST|nr:hypothetical protein RRG08_034094 [Elysia crispata]